MKNILRNSTAIIFGLTLGTASQAQEWDLDVHGFFNQFTGYAHNKLRAGDDAELYNGFVRHGKYSNQVLNSNTEIHFTPSIKLDNGMTFGINVQLEGDNAPPGTTIDESYMIIQHERYGKLVIGSTNSAAYWMSVMAPIVTSMAVDSGSVSAYVPFSAVYAGTFNSAALATTAEVSGNNDPQRISYYSPSFNGLMFGLSYAPRATTEDTCLDGENCIDNRGAWNNGIFDRRRALNDVVDIGASYKQAFGDWNVNLSARYGTANWGSKVKDNRKNPYVYGFGGQIGYQGFAIGGSYAHNSEGVRGNKAGNSTGWSAGVSYTPGSFPWSFSATTFQGKYDTGPRNQHFRAYQIATHRDIGPGVSFDIYGMYAKANNGFSDSSQQDARVKGWGLGTAINLTF